MTDKSVIELFIIIFGGAILGVSGITLYALQLHKLIDYMTESFSILRIIISLI